ncbi:MAG: ribosome recycling factor [Ilumatobacteraceae bacterium]
MTEETLPDAMDKMDKAVEHVRTMLSTIRTGRAAPALVERLTVEYYGAPVPLQQLAAIQVPEARMLLVTAARSRSARRDREGDPRQRSRCGPEQRRCGHPTELPR